MESMNDLRLAVLIDAENIPHAAIREMLEEIAKYGTPTFKRIYADWTNPLVARWKPVLLEHAITPVQQYSYTTGKNSTDSAMIIDAMDILYSGKVDGFCLITSDSDFTRLATRLREAGMKVIGMGERKTPTPFKTACDKFIYIEILKTGESHSRKLPVVKSKKGTGKQTEPENATFTSDIVKLFYDSINDLADDDGWAYLGDLGNLILKKQPDFDPRNYGYSKLVSMVRKMRFLEIDERTSGQTKGRLVYVKIK
ncbi:MAG TPA: NYN domain-containing protein [Cyclobacteriaceae bacterium]|nr:NYN domain-containing protein [Cyclobacteriaceae bacterium]